jgi:hypothetical protein
VRYYWYVYKYIYIYTYGMCCNRAIAFTSPWAALRCRRKAKAWKEAAGIGHNAGNALVLAVLGPVKEC